MSEQNTTQSSLENTAKSDLEYSDTSDGLFTLFLPNTPAGEKVWREIATLTEGTGKFLKIEADSVIQKLRSAGYTVTKAKAVSPPTSNEIDELLSGLGISAEVADESPENTPAPSFRP